MRVVFGAYSVAVITLAATREILGQTNVLVEDFHDTFTAALL